MGKLSEEVEVLNRKVEKLALHVKKLETGTFQTATDRRIAMQLFAQDFVVFLEEKHSASIDKIIPFFNKETSEYMLFFDIRGDYFSKIFLICTKEDVFNIVFRKDKTALDLEDMIFDYLDDYLVKVMPEYNVRMMKRSLVDEFQRQCNNDYDCLAQIKVLGSIKYQTVSILPSFL